MWSRQFSSFNEAISYMESAGKLKYFGRVGENHRDALYNLYIGNKVYQILLRDDGLLKVTEERYKRSDE